MDQKYYVEIWIEKSALRATFKNYLEEYKVALVPSRGYSSWTFLKEANDRIQENADGKTPLILYFGDFDPSGVDIERFLRESMNGYFGIDMEVIRIGVTKDQIEEYNLPTTPDDAEEIEKLQRDSRYNRWEHGNYRVELDALLAFVPDEFERIVKESVANYFDEDVYADVLEQQEEAKELISKKLKAELPQKIKDLMKELGLEDE
jgi:DNA topoisomerase VI subunit A